MTVSACKQVAEPPEVQAVPEQASSSSELAAVDFMSSDEEVNQAAAACDGRFDSSDDDATPKAIKGQSAELRGSTTVPVSKRGRAPKDSRSGSPQDMLKPPPANVQSADHRELPVSQSHSLAASIVEGDMEYSSRGNSQQSDATAESTEPESAEQEHEPAPAAQDHQLGGLQSSGEARPLGHVDDLSGTSVSRDAETEGHEDVNLGNIGIIEPLTSSADASLPQFNEEGQEACGQQEGHDPVREEPSAAAHRERHARGEMSNDAEQLREQHEQQVLQGRMLTTLDVPKAH